MAKKLQDQQAVRPGVLIAVGAVAAVAVGFFIVSLLTGHKGSAPASSTGTVTSVPVQPIPNLNIPTDPPPPPGSGRDPFQSVAGAGATPAPVAPAATAAPAAPAATARPEFQSSASTTNATAYVQVVSVSADHKTAQIRDGTIVYEQARPGQTLDRGVVVDSITTQGCVALHRGGNRALLCPGNRVLM